MFDICFFFFFQAEDGIRDKLVTGVQTCALPIWTACAMCILAIVPSGSILAHRTASPIISQNVPERTGSAGLCYACPLSGEHSEETLMIAFALAFILLFQGGQAVQPGVVTGQLRTIDGSPAIAVRVAAVSVPVATGNAVEADGPQYYTLGFSASTALTDKDGRYRLVNIPPGRYYIVAGAIGEATYYPAAADGSTATAGKVAPCS